MTLLYTSIFHIYIYYYTAQLQPNADTMLFMGLAVYAVYMFSVKLATMKYLTIMDDVYLGVYAHSTHNVIILVYMYIHVCARATCKS